jgi:flagellar motor component MotA
MFLTTFGAALLATLVGNLLTFYVIGKIAQRAERKRVEQMQTQLLELQRLAEKEQERMKKYVAMEG